MTERPNVGPKTAPHKRTRRKPGRPRLPARRVKTVRVTVGFDDEQTKRINRLLEIRSAKVAESVELAPLIREAVMRDFERQIQEYDQQQLAPAAAEAAA